jgi:hypothetical protein
MFENIYYFAGLFMVLFNIRILANLEKICKVSAWVDAYEEVSGKLPTKQEFKNGDFDLNQFRIATTLFTQLWLFFGIISNDWLFMCLMIFLNSIIKIKYDKLGIILYGTKTALVLSSIFILAINHFHFKIDLMCQIIKLLNN